MRAVADEAPPIVDTRLYGFCVRVFEGTGTATAPEAVGGIAADVAERVGDADGPHHDENRRSATVRGRRTARLSGT
ncbi:hypothetical protein, partial [Streptomyces sp. NPDC056634]